MSDLGAVDVKLKLNFLFMFKNKLNLRNVFAIAICLVATTMFSACSKENVPNEETQLRALLVKLYHDTNGDGWSYKANWLSDEPIDEWYGITYSSGNLKIDLRQNNLIGTIDVSGCTALTELLCWDNQLTNLNVSGCTALTKLWCAATRLTSLNVSGCTALIELYCQNNQLTDLNISGCAALTFFCCNNNLLTSLDVNGGTGLKTLWCFNNHLTNTALNTVFGMLPITDGFINVRYNLGTSTCDPSIAEAKGWTVERQY